MQKFLLVACLGLVVVSVGEYFYFSTQATVWKTGLAQWQQAVSERDTQIQDLTAKLEQVTRPTPTPEPQAAPEPTVTPALRVNTAAQDREIVKDWLDAMEQVNAAVSSGVQFARYLELMEGVTLAFNRLPDTLPIDNADILKNLNEANWCYRQAAALWSAYIKDDYDGCGAATKAAMDKFPKEIKWTTQPKHFDDAAHSSALKTNGILWKIAGKRLTAIRNAQ